MTALKLVKWLQKQDASDAYAALVDELIAAVPAGIEFESDEWNVVDWVTRPGAKRKKTLFFGAIPHSELRLIGKPWVLDGRLKSLIGPAAADLRINAIKALGYVLGAARPFSTLKTDDFKAAERWLARNYGAGTAFRLASTLQFVATWLTAVFDLRLNYKNKLTNPTVHGRYGTDEGREGKQIPLEVLRDMLLALRRDDLLAKDRFYLSVFAANLGAGFRLGEMTGLPVDCLIKEGGLLQMRVFAEKGGKPVARPIDPLVADMVEDAINTIKAATEEGRRQARRLREASRLDWSGIIADPEAFRYFVAQWAHEWTRRPEHLMINPDGAWFSKRQCFIDAIGVLKAAGGNKAQAAQLLEMSRNTFYGLLAAQEAAQRGELPPVQNSKRRGGKRASWDTDTRIASFIQLEQHTRLSIKQRSRDIVRDIIEEAQSSQLQGAIYPRPAKDHDLEARYERELRPVIRDKNGRGILYPDKALLVIEKYSLSEQRGTKANDFTLVVDKHINRWMAGEARSRGTGNHEDSVFHRLGIVDPRTGDTASFTWHAIRHWLDTMYENGGFTQDQIALMFNRKNKRQNAVYDQTSRKTRVDRMSQGIRDRMVVGVAADTYHQLAELSQDEAEEYLEAAMRQLNPMPHGLCTLDWSTTPCPHHLSCFKHDGRKRGPCEHLVVDGKDKDQMRQIKRINRIAQLQVVVMNEQLELLGESESPQLDHFKAVRNNTARMLQQIQDARNAE